MEKSKQESIQKSDSFLKLTKTVHRLRAPDGCAWDKAQTPQSLRPYLIEEAHEVLEVLDQVKEPADLKKEKIKANLKEELGDLLMQVMLHSEIASEEKSFDVFDVCEGLNDKLIRRHPHVFAKEKNSQKATSSSDALSVWEKEKAKEKKDKKEESILDGLPKSLPTLARAARTIEKVSRVGFQWKDLVGPLSKLDEEIAELKEEIAHPLDKQNKARLESELGDVLFVVCNLAYHLKLSPEDALRSTLSRFENRFRFVETGLKFQGKLPENSTLEEMDHYWDQAKVREKFIWVGITGEIGSGKSEVSRILESKGYFVLKADDLGKEVTEEGSPASKEIQSAFGTTDRLKLREIILKDPTQKEQLEKIIHPKVMELSFMRCEEVLKKLPKTSQKPFFFYESALLFETGRAKQFDHMIYVETREDLQKERILKRDASLTLAQVEKLIALQTSKKQFKERSQFLVQNSDTLAALEKKVTELIEKLKSQF